VYPSALVAEIVPAPALHVIAPRGFLNPRAALRALPEILVLSVFDEFLIGLVPLPIVHLVLLACLASVELGPAIQTIMLLTLVAREIRDPLLEEERVIALDVGAP